VSAVSREGASEDWTANGWRTTTLSENL